MSVIGIDHVVVLVFIGFSSIQRGMQIFITLLCIILLLTGMVYPWRNNFNMSPSGAVSEFESKSKIGPHNILQIANTVFDGFY